MNNKCRCSSRPISWAIIVLLYVNDVAEKMRSINRLNAYESTLQQCSNNISVIEDNQNHDLVLLRE